MRDGGPQTDSRDFKACASFLDHPDVFENARTLEHIEALPRRSWEKRTGLPKQQLEVTAACLAELGSRISDYYFEREGRGENCKVEHRRRASGVDSFFAYPADYSSELLGYDADGESAHIFQSRSKSANSNESPLRTSTAWS